ncbi:MAG TPA: LysR family transcriptional regulator [Spirochaetota bacterium]|nr:LysR family transcriptional regulator [Spirochaetota bacterium]
MNKKKQPGDMPETKMHLWPEKDGGVYFGQGRYDLLIKIEELGSLKLAAQAMGISYRGAWGKIKKTEEIIGEKLIEKESNKEGYGLTEFGKKFTTEFNALHKDVLEFAEKRSREMMDRIF